VPALPLIEPIPDRSLSDAILTSWQAEAPTAPFPFRQARDQVAYRHQPSAANEPRTARIELTSLESGTGPKPRGAFPDRSGLVQPVRAQYVPDWTGHSEHPHLQARHRTSPGRSAQGPDGPVQYGQGRASPALYKTAQEDTGRQDLGREDRRQP